MFETTWVGRRTAIALVLLAAAAMVAPAASGADKSDALDRAVVSGSLDVRSPDRKHPDRLWSTPDAADRGSAVPANPASRPASRVVDYRSADTRDAALRQYAVGRAPTLSATRGGFDWGDATIGAAAAFGAMLLAAVAVARTRSRRILQT